MIKNSELKTKGYFILNFPLDEIVLNFVQEKNWIQLDQYFLEISKPNGQLNQFLLQFLDFSTLEHIIAIRQSTIDEDDDDGIWHDDGSRFMGFSLSLNENHNSILGGELRFKLKDSSHTEFFSPLPYGKIILFLSGVYGYEHMVSAVTRGERIVVAGWCS